MATTTAPVQVTCPGMCGPTTCGEQVAAHGFGDFAATQVTVDPCTALVAQGWTGPQMVERKSRADHLLPVVGRPVRHRDGLVTFR